MLRCKIHGIYVVKDKKDKRTYMGRVIIGLAQVVVFTVGAAKSQYTGALYSAHS
jgi:glucose uptake protein GlcU